MSVSVVQQNKNFFFFFFFSASDFLERLVSVSEMTYSIISIIVLSGRDIKLYSLTQSTFGPVTTWMGDYLRAGKPSGYTVCNQPSRSTQPSTLCGMVKWVSFGLSDNKWRWWAWFPSSLQAGVWLKSVGLVQRSATVWRCSAFIAWTGWSLAIDWVIVLIIIISSIIEWNILRYYCGHLPNVVWHSKPLRSSAPCIARKGHGLGGRVGLVAYDKPILHMRLRCSWC